MTTSNKVNRRGFGLKEFEEKVLSKFVNPSVNDISLLTKFIDSLYYMIIHDPFDYSDSYTFRKINQYYYHSRASAYSAGKELWKTQRIVRYFDIIKNIHDSK